MQLRGYQDRAIDALPTASGIAYSGRNRGSVMPKQCCIEGCTNDTSKGAKGMCGMHAARVRRYGDPNFITPEAQRRVSNRDAQLRRFEEVKPDTYRKIHGEHIHRVIAEQMIGRPLAKGEIVHHIDGNKHNNDPSNLQVMTQSEHMKLHLAEMMQARKKVHGY